MAKIQDIRNRTKRTNGTRKISQIKYIVRHHSATNDGNFDTFWPYWNKTRGWGTGGYHEIILRDGTVQLCYDPHEITNGVANMNTLCYHICLVGNGSFTKEQERAWDERVAYNMKRLGISINNVKGHGELQSTTCPGIDMNTVRARIKGTATKPAPQPKTASTSTSSNNTKLVVDGLWGPATTRALQKHFGTTVDGVINGQPSNRSTRNIPSAQFGTGGSMLIRAMQRHYGTTVDGVISGTSRLITAMQRKYGLKIVDGYVSKPSNLVKEIQRRLNNNTL